MTALFASKRFVALAALLVTVSALSGCASFGPSVGGSVPYDPDSVAKPNPHEIVVVKKFKKGKPVATKIPYAPSQVVDDVLTKSGAKGWFNRVTVKVVRQTEKGPVAMDVEYDNGADRVEPLYDYAIHPGDRVVVEEDPSTIIDDMFGSISPLP